MRAQTIAVKQSTGRVLCCTIFRAGGKKLLAKGHVISDEDAKMLETEGMNEVWVTELEEGEIGEDDAVMQVAGEIGCGSLEIRLAAGGRANLFATENCCMLVDDELLKQINCAASMVIATSLNFSYARAGQRVATVKSTPFAVTGPQLDAVISIVKERGPILQARPVRNPTVAFSTLTLSAATGRGSCSRTSCGSGWIDWAPALHLFWPRWKRKAELRGRCSTCCVPSRPAF